MFEHEPEVQNPKPYQIPSPGGGGEADEAKLGGDGSRRKRHRRICARALCKLYTGLVFKALAVSFVFVLLKLYSVYHAVEVSAN